MRNLIMKLQLPLTLPKASLTEDEIFPWKRYCKAKLQVSVVNTLNNTYLVVLHSLASKWFNCGGPPQLKLHQKADLKPNLKNEIILIQYCTYHSLCASASQVQKKTMIAYHNRSSAPFLKECHFQIKKCWFKHSPNVSLLLNLDLVFRKEGGPPKHEVQERRFWFPPNLHSKSKNRRLFMACVLDKDQSLPTFSLNHSSSWFMTSGPVTFFE